MGGVVDGGGRTYQIDQLEVDVPVTIRHAAFRRNTPGDVIHVLADNVTLDGCTITGAGRAVAGRSRGIVVSGVGNFALLNTVISSLDFQGVQLNNTSRFLIEGCRIHDIAYAGIMMLSSRHGVVRANEVHSITQPDGFINSYGITVSRTWSRSVLRAPHSEHILILDNRVRGVRKWKGLDTHGGRFITFSGNRVTDCLVGIAAVPSKGMDGQLRHAPLNCAITDNTVDALTEEGTRQQGIAVTGATSPSGRIREPATGSVRNNTVLRHGAASSPDSAGVLLTCTADFEISGNTIQECSTAGISLLRDNQRARITENHIIDVWSRGEPMSAAVRAHPANNSAQVEGNTLSRADKVAPMVNRVGLDLGAQNSQVQRRRNSFTAAVYPVLGARG